MSTIMRRLGLNLQPKECTHQGQIRDVQPASQGCEGCRREGLTPVKLRSCVICGHVGCCDSSVGRHATRHFEETGHAIMRSIEPGERWMWCYEDEIYIENTRA